jgi:hypothetical protein
MGLRAVYNALSGVMAPIWVAQDAGLFVKHRGHCRSKIFGSDHVRARNGRRRRGDWTSR